MRRGSITLFLSLLLGLFLLLLTAALFGVRRAAARTQALLSVDVGLFSLFGGYDRTAYDRFGLLFLEGGQGGEGLFLSSLYEEFSSYAELVLTQNRRDLSFVGGGFTGYRLITDDGGRPLEHQIMRAAASLEEEGELPELPVFEEGERTALQEAERRGQAMEASLAFLSYLQQQGIPETEEQETALLEGLGLLKEGGLVSPLISGREKEAGLLVADSMTFLPLKEGILDRYLWAVTGDYVHPTLGLLTCQREYLAFRKSSDEENMREAMRRLRWMREGQLLFRQEAPEVLDAGEGSMEEGGELPGRKEWEIYLQATEETLLLLRGESVDDRAYETYLTLWLVELTREEKLTGLMDCIELSMRTRLPFFCLDHGITAVELSVDVAEETGEVLTVTRAFGYD